jgi:hypothetical protein
MERDDKPKTGRDWTPAELEIVVEDYLSMLRMEQAGIPFSKTEHRLALRRRLPARSEGSIEFKHANISAALRDLGMTFIDGYKPRGNYQQALIAELRRQLR